MHDIDRTTLEYGQEMSGFEAEQFEFGQGEWSGEGGANAMFSETEEMELANELLSVSNEAELEQFLGNFLRKAASVAGGIIKSPVGQAIGGVLKGVAKKPFPWPAAPSAAISAARWAPRSAAAWPRPPATRWGWKRRRRRTKTANSRAPSSSCAWPPTPSTAPRRHAVRAIRAPSPRRPPARRRASSRPACWDAPAARSPRRTAAAPVRAAA